MLNEKIPIELRIKFIQNNKSAIYFFVYAQKKRTFLF